MSKIMSIEQAAEIMGVDYKTIYRLIKTGDLPAAKIGRIFRIRESDLHSYFDRQVEQVKKTAQEQVPFAQQEIRCGFCGNRIFSSLSVAQYCEICSLPICINCYTLKKIRFCSEHIQTSPPEEKKTRIKCGRCSRLIVGSARFLIKCREPGCEELLCRVCSLLPQDPYCKKHRRTKSKTENVLKEAIEMGKDVIPCSDAREKELALIRDMKTRLSCPLTLLDPMSQLEFVTTRVKTDIRENNAIRDMANLRGKRGDTAAIPDTYPLNESLAARYSVKVGPLKKNTVIVEARVFSRLEPYAEQGFDADPVKASELGELIDGEIKSASKSKYFKALLIASPTGWDKNAVALIAGSKNKKGFMHNQFCIYLIDLKTGELYYNQGDDKTIPFLAIFTPEKLEDYICEARDYVQGKMENQTSLTLGAAVRESRISEWILKRAFSELSQSPDYRLDIIDDNLTLYSK